MMTKVAIVHDWLISQRGGEKVLESILDLFPDADVFYLFGHPQSILSEKFHNRNFQCSFLNSFPKIQHYYKILLPLFPYAVESFDFKSYGLIISTSHCVAKGIIPHPFARHVCYLHSPMRYVWDQQHAYFPIKTQKIIKKIITVGIMMWLKNLRIWDVVSSVRCDVFIANSFFVRKRCQQYYGQDAAVVHPPCNVERFFTNNASQKKTHQVLLFGAWVPYKNMMWALQILDAQGFSVLAAGTGKELVKASKIFKKNKKISFFLNPTDAVVQELYAHSHVFLMPGVEDFGITPLEAMASGLWVVAPKAGGVLDSVVEGKTGFLFEPYDAQSLVMCLQKALGLPKTDEDIAFVKKHMQYFSQKSFQFKFMQTLRNYNII